MKRGNMDIEMKLLRTQLLLSAIERELLASGRLMSPNEVRQHINRDGSHVDSRVIGWALCGDVPQEMFEMLLHGTPVSTSALVWDSAAGTPFLALQQQLGTWAHRFILPIVGRTARSFTNSFSETGIVTSLSTRLGEVAAINRVSAMSGVVATPLGGVELDSVSLESLFDDICNVSLLFLRPDSMASLGDQIEKVCLTTVTSAEVKTALELKHSLVGNVAH